MKRILWYHFNIEIDLDYFKGRDNLMVKKKFVEKLSTRIFSSLTVEIVSIDE